MSKAPRQYRIEAEAQSRDEKALRLYARGMTWQQVSDELGYGGAPNAHRAVKRRMQELRQLTLNAAEELRQKAQLELDASRLRVNRRIAATRKDSVAFSGEALLLKINESERKLWGLDAPQRTELTGADGAPLSIAAAAEPSPEVAARLVREAFGAHASQKAVVNGGGGQSPSRDAPAAEPVRAELAASAGDSGALPEDTAAD